MVKPVLMFKNINANVFFMNRRFIFNFLIRTVVTLFIVVVILFILIKNDKSTYIDVIF